MPIIRYLAGKAPASAIRHRAGKSLRRAKSPEIPTMIKMVAGVLLSKKTGSILLDIYKVDKIINTPLGGVLIITLPNIGVNVF